MLKTLDALLSCSVKSIENNVLNSHIKHLEQLGIADAEDKIHSLENAKYHYNIDDEQKEIVLKLSNIVEKIFKEDESLQSYVENINLRVTNGECINLYHELINIIYDRIKSDKLLQSELVNLMVENFEILIENKISCKEELIHFLSENDEIINSGQIIQQEIRQKIIQLKNYLHNDFVKPIQSLCGSCQQLWVKRITHSRQTITQSL